MHQKDDNNLATSHCGKKRRYDVHFTLDKGQDHRKSFKQDGGEQRSAEHRLKSFIEGTPGLPKIQYKNIPGSFVSKGGALPSCNSNGPINLPEIRVAKNQTVPLPDNLELVTVGTHQSGALLKLIGQLINEDTLKGNVEGNGNIRKQRGHGGRNPKDGVDGAQQQHLVSNTDVDDSLRQANLTTSPANDDRHSEDSTAVCLHTAAPKNIKTADEWDPRCATERLYSFTHENGICKGPTLSEILEAKGVMTDAPTYSCRVSSKPNQNDGNSHDGCSSSQSPPMPKATSIGKQSDDLAKPNAAKVIYASANTSGEAHIDYNGHAAWVSICDSLSRIHGEPRHVRLADEHHDDSVAVLESSKISGSPQVADAQVHAVRSTGPSFKLSSDFGPVKPAEISEHAPIKQIAGQTVVPLFYIGGGGSNSVDNKGDVCSQQISRFNAKFIPILNSSAVSWSANSGTLAGNFDADYLQKLGVIMPPTKSERAVLEECEGAAQCVARDQTPSSIVEKNCCENRTNSGEGVATEFRLSVPASLVRKLNEVKTEPAMPLLDPKTRTEGNK